MEPLFRGYPADADESGPGPGRADLAEAAVVDPVMESMAARGIVREALSGPCRNEIAAAEHKVRSGYPSAHHAAVQLREPFAVRVQDEPGIPVERSYIRHELRKVMDMGDVKALLSHVMPELEHV